MKISWYFEIEGFEQDKKKFGLGAEIYKGDLKEFEDKIKLMSRSLAMTAESLYMRTCLKRMGI